MKDRKWKFVMIILAIVIMCVWFGNLAYIQEVNYGPIPGIDSKSNYLCYYGDWDSDMIEKARRFDLVIIHPRSRFKDGGLIDASLIEDIKRGTNGILGDGDDVIVIGYISIGEDDVPEVDKNGDGIWDPREGDGTGPVYYDPENKRFVYENNGCASWYLDEIDNESGKPGHDGKPDRNEKWGSFYVNAGDPDWQYLIKNNRILKEGEDLYDWPGTEAIISELGCDGLFLDTVMTANPYDGYPETGEGMAELIEKIRAWYPDKYIIANNPHFYFDSEYEDSFANPKHTITFRKLESVVRRSINGAMFECFYCPENRDWNIRHIAPGLNQEAKKKDGFTVFAIDYVEEIGEEDISDQIDEVIENQGWTDYIAPYVDLSRSVIGWDVYKHNPPKVVEGPDLFEIGSTYAKIRWMTNKPTKGKVRYGKVGAGMKEEASYDPIGEWYYTEHKIWLKGLEPETTYEYKIISICEDETGEEKEYEGEGKVNLLQLRRM
ncbi:MAG: hypothetical protein QME40_01140 [bacterium]|nr:hypothetical protein [bacterium]